MLVRLLLSVAVQRFSSIVSCCLGVVGVLRFGVPWLSAGVLGRLSEDGQLPVCAGACLDLLSERSAV